MLEVQKIDYKGKQYLKLKLHQFDPELIRIITSIPGWFKGREHLVYGLPFEKLEELHRKTMNHVVVYKFDEMDDIGSLVKGIDTSDVPDTYCVDYTPKAELRPHQIVAFNLLLQRDYLLISDQEGVGKTFPILCSHEAKIRHGIIRWGLYITKASLIYDVYNQAKRATNLKTIVVAGTPKQRINIYEKIEREDYDLVIVSYELYRTDINHFLAIHKTKPFDVVYIDEAHKAKDPTTQIGKLIHEIDSSQRYAITASPIINNVIELYNIFKWLRLTPYTYKQFVERYCILDQFGRPAKYQNLGEIKKLIQSNMLRRTKAEVLKDLPPVVTMYRYVEMTPIQKKLYKAIEEGQELVLEELELEDVPSQLAKYMRLAQIAESAEIVVDQNLLGGKSGKAASAKLAELEDLLEEIVKRGEKAVVFSRSKRFTNIMYNYFQKYNPAIVTGDISAQARAGQEVSDRQMQVDKFQNDPSCKVIFCSEGAAREGITLTAANNVIFSSKPWSPAYVQQCLGRCWRFGQDGGTTGTVNVYTIVAKGTVDERIEQLLGDKQFLINSVVDQPISTEKLLTTLEK